VRWVDTEAICVGRRRLSGADRLVTLLAPDLGRVMAVARGDCLPRNRQGGALEPFGVSRVVLLPTRGGGLFRVDTAERVRHFPNLTSDLTRCQAAGLICAWARGLSREGEASGPYRLLASALALLDEGEPVLPLVAGFLWRMSGELGVAPDLSACAGCRLPGPHEMLRIDPGGAVCGACRKPGDLPVPPPCGPALAVLLAGADAPLPVLSDQTARPLISLAQAYLRGHFGVGLP